MIKYQRPTSDEVNEIRKLLNKSWFDTYSDIYSSGELKKITSKWHSVRAIKDRLNDKSAYIETAKESNKIIGICDASFDIKSRKINIQKLHVLKEYQGQGIGSKLIERVINAYPGAIKADLEVMKENYKAMAFYIKQGYLETGKKTFETAGIKIPCIVMEKTIE